MMGIIMSIAVVFDISEKIDDFIAKGPTLKQIAFDYYVNFVLHFANLFSSLLIFLSVIFFTAKMAHNTEIVAILSSGVSFKRMLRPYFIGATILASISFCMNHWVIPHANKTRLDFENTYIRNKVYYSDKDTHKLIGDGQSVYFYQFRNLKGRGYKFTWEHWENNTLTDKFYASSIDWDSTTGSWKLKNYVWRHIDSLEETLVTGDILDTTFNLHPSDFTQRLENVQAMDKDELDQFIAEETAEGSTYVPFHQIEKHQRSSYPFSTYILVLMGVSIASRKVRGGIGLHIASGIAICAAYILCMKASSVFATNSGLDPLVAVWIPNIIFSLGALYLFNRAPK